MLQPAPAPKAPTPFRRVLSAITRRPVVKLAALLLAVLFWGVVVASDPSLPIAKVFVDAQVTVSGADTLRTRGFTVMEDLTGRINTKLRVSVTQGTYERTTVANFSPRLDLTQITEAGKQRVYFTVGYTNSGEVIAFEPAYLELTVEPYTSRGRIPVSVKLAGDLPEGVYVESYTVDPGQLTVSGPRSIVDRVSRISITLEQDGLSLSRPHDSLTAHVALEDFNGNLIEDSRLRITNESLVVDSVRLDVAVMPLMTVAIDPDFAVIGQPAHGYVLQEVRLSPWAVTLVADEVTLASLQSLLPQTPLDITGARADQQAERPLAGIDRFVYTSADRVTIEAVIVPALHTHTYLQLPVTVLNVKGNLAASLSQRTMTASLTGPYQGAESLTADAIHLYIDATGLDVGSYEMPVLFRVDGVTGYELSPEHAQLTLTLR